MLVRVHSIFISRNSPYRPSPYFNLIKEVDSILVIGFQNKKTVNISSFALEVKLSLDIAI